MAKYNAVPDEKIIEILKRVKDGAYISDLQQEYNTSNNSIQTWCRRIGLKWNKKSRTNRDWESIKARVMA